MNDVRADTVHSSHSLLGKGVIFPALSENLISRDGPINMICDVTKSLEVNPWPKVLKHKGQDTEVRIVTEVGGVGFFWNADPTYFHNVIYRWTVWTLLLNEAALTGTELLLSSRKTAVASFINISVFQSIPLYTYAFVKHIVFHSGMYTFLLRIWKCPSICNI